MTTHKSKEVKALEVSDIYRNRLLSLFRRVGIRTQCPKCQERVFMVKHRNGLEYLYDDCGVKHLSGCAGSAFKKE